MAKQTGIFSRLASLVKRQSPQSWFSALMSSGTTSQGRPTRSYTQVDAVYSCVRFLASAMSSMPLMVSTADDEVIETGVLARLSRQPNENQSGRAFWRETTALLQLFGRVHWHLELSGGVPTSVTVINPLQMRAKVKEGTRELIGWEFRAGGQVEPIPLDEVHTIIDPNYERPDRPWEGVGPRAAAGMAIAQYYKSDIANESSLDNDMVPGGVFMADKPMSDDQARDFMAKMGDDHAGSSKRRRRMLLRNGMKLERVAADFKDMEFTELKFMSREAICVAFGVKPTVVGYGGRSQLGSGKEDETAHEITWTTTILGLASWLSEEWDCGVLSRFNNDRSLTFADQLKKATHTRVRKALAGRAYRDARQRALGLEQRFFSWFDSSGVGPVGSARLRSVEQAERWQKMGVPLNDILQATDAPFEEQEWGDTWYKPIGLVDVQDEAGIDDPAGSPADDPPGAPPETPEEPDDPETSSAVAERRALDEKELSAIWEAWRTSWLGLDRTARGRLRRHFQGLRIEVLASLGDELGDGDQAKSIRPDARRDVIAQVLFSLTDANRKLRVLVGPLVREAYRLGGQQSMREASEAQGSDDEQRFNISDPEVANAIRRREVQLTNVNRTLRRRLEDELVEGLAKQETLSDIANRMRREFNLANNRASTIARTEIGRAVEEARHHGRRQAGTPLKSWLWSRRESGRPGHAETERLTLEDPVINDHLFTVAQTGNTCPHPRATNTPEDDINCGCTTLARFEGDSIRSVIDLYRKCGFLSYEQLITRDLGGNASGGGDVEAAA